jgi:hypothetical protein
LLGKAPKGKTIGATTGMQGTVQQAVCDACDSIELQFLQSKLIFSS